MKLEDNSKPKNNKRRIIFFGFILILIIYFLSIFRINKIEFIGNTDFVDLNFLKISSLNFLKDQPTFWFDKSKFENLVKSELPQIKDLKYKIVNSSNIQVTIIADDICCIVKDQKEKNFVISSDGKVTREFSGNPKSEFILSTDFNLEVNNFVNKKLITVLKSLINKSYQIENVLDNHFFITQDSIYFNTPEGKKIFINEDTDLKKINDNFKTIKSHLEQNQKNYSILDFRFDKIVVK